MKKRIVLVSIIGIAVIVIGSIVFLNTGAPYESNKQCRNDCITDGWHEGQCVWPQEMSKEEVKKYIAKVENRGPCVVATFWGKSKHCGNEGQCNCYCLNHTEEALKILEESPQ